MLTFNKTSFLPKNTHSELLDLSKFYPPNSPTFSTLIDSLSFTSKQFFKNMELFSRFIPPHFPYMLMAHHLIFPSKFSFSIPEIL